MQLLMLLCFIVLSGCIDINECTSSPCDHTCTNTAGSFVCSCDDGYVLDSDGLSCNGECVNMISIY